MRPVVTLSVRISPELMADLKRQADNERVKLRELVETLLVNGLKTRTGKGKAQ